MAGKKDKDKKKRREKKRSGDLKSILSSLQSLTARVQELGAALDAFQAASGSGGQQAPRRSAGVKAPQAARKKPVAGKTAGKKITGKKTAAGKAVRKKATAGKTSPVKKALTGKTAATRRASTRKTAPRKARAKHT